MIAVCDQGGARQALPSAQAYLGGDLIADEAHHTGCGESPQMRKVLRVDQALDRFIERDAGRDEDGQDDCEPGELLAPKRAEKERDSERQSGERVAHVMDQVGEKGDRVRQDEDRQLHAGGEGEDREADRDSLDTFSRANDRRVDESMRVPVVVSVLMTVLMMCCLERL